MEQKLKMYILVKEDIPLGKAVVGIAHASLACYLKFQRTEEVEQWLSRPFYKTVCNLTLKGTSDALRSLSEGPQSVKMLNSYSLAFQSHRSS